MATKSFNKNNENVYRGLFPLIPGKLSHKEGYDMGKFNFGPETEEERAERIRNPILGDTPRLKFPNDAKRQEEADFFYSVMEKHKNLLEDAGNTLMSLIAEAGGEKTDFFAHMFKPHPHHTYRTIMYPYRDEKDIPKGAFLQDGRS